MPKNHPFKFYAIIILLFSFIWSCKDEEPVPPDPPVIEEPVAPAYCSEIGTSISALVAEQIQDNMIIEVENQDTLINVIYDDGSSITICSDSLNTYAIDSMTSELTISFSDSNSFSEFIFLGTIELSSSVELNPSGYAPLTASLSVEAQREGYVSIRVIGQDGPYSDVIKTFGEISNAHTVPILGLYLDYENEVIMEFYSRHDLLLHTDTLMIETEDTDLGFPFIQIDVNDVESMAPGFQLISHLHLWPNTPFMIDPYGKIRYFLDWRGHPEITSLAYDVGMERLANGNYYFGNLALDEVYEVDVLGYVINIWPLPPGYDYHHNVYEKADGNLLMTSEKENSDHIDFGVTVEDRILEMDRNTGMIVKFWDMRNVLDETRNNFVDFQWDFEKDWLHLNAVVHDEMDNTIIFSGRHQSTICKVNYDDEIQWIISPRVDFGTNRNGVDLEAYYLTAVDANGDAYDEDVQNGSENIEEFEWPWYQHAVKILGPNRILCFDNGNNRNFGNAPSEYSRAVIYNIDPVNMTISQEWAYGRDRGTETRSHCCSDADYIEEYNHIIFSPGLNTNNWNGSGGRVVEVDYDTKDVIFEARINSEGITFHRTERLTIYPE